MMYSELTHSQFSCTSTYLVLSHVEKIKIVHVHVNMHAGTCKHFIVHGIPGILHVEIEYNIQIYICAGILV